MVKPFAPSEKIERAAREILPIIEAGDKEKALGKISAFQADEPGARYTLVRVLVSTGQIRRSRAILECATEAFERLMNKSAPPNDPLLYYDMTNGYSELFAIAVHDDRANVFDCENVVKRALRYADRGPKGDTWSLTNQGNLYDQVGRPIEALRSYERALTIDPNFGMAIGNKALALATLAPITRYPVTNLSRLTSSTNKP